jgi:hypothetical protein
METYSLRLIGRPAFATRDEYRAWIRKTRRGVCSMGSVECESVWRGRLRPTFDQSGRQRKLCSQGWPEEVCGKAPDL